MKKKLYGAEDAGDLDWDKAKIKVSMYINGDLLTAVRTSAGQRGMKYQALINEVLRSHFLEETNLQEIKEHMEELSSRITILENTMAPVAKRKKTSRKAS